MSLATLQATGNTLINASRQTRLIAAMVTRSNDFGMLMMAWMSHKLLFSCAVACADIPECFTVRQQDSYVIISQPLPEYVRGHPWRVESCLLSYSRYK